MEQFNWFSASDLYVFNREGNHKIMGCPGNDNRSVFHK